MGIYHELCEVGKKETGIDIRQTRKRTDETLDVRFAIANVLVDYCNWSLSGVGRAMGRDHTTIINQKKKHGYRYSQRESYAKLYDKLVSTVMDKEMTDNGENLLRLAQMIGE